MTPSEEYLKAWVSLECSEPNPHYLNSPSWEKKAFVFLVWLSKFLSWVTWSSWYRSFKGVGLLAGLGEDGSEMVGSSEYERSIFLRILIQETLRIVLWQHLFLKKKTTMPWTVRKTDGSWWFIKTQLPFNSFQVTRASSRQFGESDNQKQSDINNTWIECFEGRQIYVNCCILAVLAKKKAVEAARFLFFSFKAVEQR